MRTSLGVPSSATTRTPVSRPYPPSWLDSLFGGIDRLPGPAPTYYIILWLVFFFAETFVKWRDGTYPPGTIFPFHVWFAAVGPYILLCSRYLNTQASESLHLARAVLTATEAEYDQIHYELTTTPRRPALVASVLSVLFVLLWFPFKGNPVTPELAPLKLFTSPSANVLDALIFLLTWALFGAAMYRILHQLRVIERVTSAHLRINLFELGPIYAFSRLTVRTALTLLMGGYLWLTAASGALHRPADLVMVVFLQLLALVVFVWPLLKLHRRQVEEKSRLQREAVQRLGVTIGELHKRVDEGELTTTGQDGLNKALDSLLKELGVLEKLATWPWPPETLRLLATAIVGPVVVWFIQYSLSNLLGS